MIKLSRDPEAVRVYRTELIKFYGEESREQIELAPDAMVVQKMEELIDTVAVGMTQFLNEVATAFRSMVPGIVKVARALEACIEAEQKEKKQ